MVVIALGILAADIDPAGVADRDRAKPGGVLQLDHRDVLAAVVADDVRDVGAPVTDVVDGDLRGAGDHVVVGDDLTG